MGPRLKEMAEAPEPNDVLEVLFPKRIARFGTVFFLVLLALFAGWVRTAEEMPWLAVVAGTGCFLAALMSFRQLVRPKVLARADREGLEIFTTRLKGGSQRFDWSDVRELSYEERQVGQFVHKVVRLHFSHPVDVGLRQIQDDENVAHLDAFAADPGGEELLEKLKALRTPS